MTVLLSKLPELRQLQLLAGPSVCPFCLRPLRRLHGGRRPFVCWSADCRTAMENTYLRAWRRANPERAQRHQHARSEKQRSGTVSVWKQIDDLKAKFDGELSNAKEAAKELGFKDVKCSDVGLTWTAKANPAAKYDFIKGRPNIVGPFKTAAELVAAMKRYIVVRDDTRGKDLTEADHARAAAFLDAKR